MKAKHEPKVGDVVKLKGGWLRMVVLSLPIGTGEAELQVCGYAVGARAVYFPVAALTKCFWQG